MNMNTNKSREGGSTIKQDMVVAQTLEQINNHESTYKETPNLRKKYERH